MDQPALCTCLCCPMVAILYHSIGVIITIFDGASSNGKEACLHTRSLWGSTIWLCSCYSRFETRIAMQIIWMKPSETMPKHRRSSRQRRLPSFWRQRGLDSPPPNFFPENMWSFSSQKHFSTAKLCYGVLAQICFGPIRCSFNTRFRTRFRKVLVQIVPVQIPLQVPKGSGEDTCWGSGGFCAVPEGSVGDTLWGSAWFRCRYLVTVRFRTFPVQVLGEVPEGYGADTWLGSRGFWCRYLVRFRKFPVQLPDEVPEGLGEDAWWGFGRFRGQIPCEVPEGSVSETLWGSGGFWRRRCLVRFWRVLVQMLCEIPKGSDFFNGISTIYIELWQTRRIFQAVGDSTWVYFDKDIGLPKISKNLPQ